MNQLKTRCRNRWPNYDLEYYPTSMDPDAVKTNIKNLGLEPAELELYLKEAVEFRVGYRDWPPAIFPDPNQVDDGIRHIRFDGSTFQQLRHPWRPRGREKVRIFFWLSLSDEVIEILHAVPEKHFQRNQEQTLTVAAMRVRRSSFN